VDYKGEITKGGIKEAIMDAYFVTLPRQVEGKKYE